jgi:hypothetical protein
VRVSPLSPPVSAAGPIPRPHSLLQCTARPQPPTERTLALVSCPLGNFSVPFPTPRPDSAGSPCAAQVVGNFHEWPLLLLWDSSLHPNRRSFGRGAHRTRILCEAARLGRGHLSVCCAERPQGIGHGPAEARERMPSGRPFPVAFACALESLEAAPVRSQLSLLQRPSPGWKVDLALR